jgi:hypothetical protein
MPQLREDYDEFLARHGEIIVVGPEKPDGFPPIFSATGTVKF